MKQKLFHVVLIPDGNRRWAKKRGLLPWKGHEKSARVLEDVIRKAFNSGVTHFSLWGSSINNLKKRPKAEVSALLKIYKKYFTQIFEHGEEEEIRARVVVLGRWREQFPSDLIEIIDKCQEKTRKYKDHTLTFFLAYNGDEEMLQAVRNIVDEGYKKDDIDASLLKQHLYTRELPPVDFLIRTGGEPHLSVGFMMWDMANAQLFFTDKNCPSFGPDELVCALDEYHTRLRRRGA